jgi:Spy/CpxP family protein refolding chaperone
MVCLIGVLCLSTSLQSQAQNGGPNPSAESGMDFSFEPAATSFLLQHQRELNLSPQQVKNLLTVRADFRKQNLKKLAELQLAELELGELQAKSPADLKAIAEKITQGENIKTQLRIDGARIDETAKAALTREQRQKLDEAVGKNITTTSQQNSSDPYLQQQIRSVLDEKYKDQKVVELETSEAIATKLLDWAKTFGIIVGVPLTILGALLGFFGIKSVSDIRTLADSGRKDISSSVASSKEEISTLVVTGKEGIEKTFQDAQEKAEAIRTRGDALVLEYQKLEGQLAEVAALAQQVPALAGNLKELTSKVNLIEEKITIESSTIPTAQTDKLKVAFENFQNYFQKIGFNAPKGEVKIKLDDKLQLNSFYEVPTNTVIVSSSLVDDFEFSLHQYVHHVLSAVNKRYLSAHSRYAESIGEGLADYFTCSFTGDPLVGEKSIHKFQKAFGKDRFPNDFMRNLKNDRSFKEAYSSDPKTSEVHSVGEIWGGAFWEIRELLGQDLADKLLFATWKSLSPSDLSGLSEGKFVKRLLKQYEPLEDGNQRERLEEIFRRRDLEF